MSASAVSAAILAEGTESVEFLNDLVAQLWPYANVAGSQLIKDIVEPMFATMLPGPLKKMHFQKIDLGSVPIKFDRVDVHTRTQNSIKLDLDVSWNSKSDIELDSGVFGTFGVESVKLKGRLSMMMQPLVPKIPLIGATQVAFINPPDVELDFTGLAQIADIAFIRGAIRKIIDQVIASLFVLPNRFLVKLDPGNDYFSTYIIPLGYLRITVLSGSGFKPSGKIIKDIPDCYSIVTMGAEEPWKTKTINNKTEPVWNETRDFLFSDLDQVVHVHVWDDDIAGDDSLGTASVTVKQLLHQGNAKELALVEDGKDTGSKLTMKAEFYEFSDDKAHFEINSSSEVKGHYSGLMSIIVAGAVNIPDEPELMPFCKVTAGEQEFLTPAVCKMPGIDPRLPCFDMTFRVPLTAGLVKSGVDVKFELMNGKVKMGEGVTKFTDVLNASGMILRKAFQMDNGATLKTEVVLKSMRLHA